MTILEVRSDNMPNLARVQAVIWWIISTLMIMGIFLPFLLGGPVPESEQAIYLFGHDLIACSHKLSEISLR